jgi:hypothetical protein
MSDFQAKNHRRRTARADRKTYVKARAARRRYAINGAFGTIRGTPEYELCAHGTRSVLEEDAA